MEGSRQRRPLKGVPWARCWSLDPRALLLATGDALLVEHTANDSYWGDGGDGSGKNRLGEILMSVREELRAREQEQTS